MKQKTLIAITLCLLMFMNLGKAQNKFDIKGIVTDTTDVPLAFATVMALDASDSTYINFTQTNKDGRFVIHETLDKPIIIKISYLSYFSFEKIIKPQANHSIDLGNIKLIQINNVLFEVVVKEAKAPLKMHGDTIEYDATTFKVPQGSSVEDLLRKLPGIEVAPDGSIKSQGQSVNKVTVDGKRFFADDPTMATKNLPAESLSKVQVFNEKTEQEKLTGLTLEKEQKTMNLELKDDFKKGAFGKCIGGLGVENRANENNSSTVESKWELKSSYNKFNKTEQLSFVGVSNNTGRNGMNWNDFQDFRGQQSWDWNQSEELFGFGNNMRYNSPGNELDIDDFGTVEGFFGDADGGIPKNDLAGLNYNFDNGKTKLSSNYSFKQNDLFSDAIRKRQFFLSDQSYFTNDKSNQDRHNASHRAEIIFEQQIDSLNSVILKLRGNAIYTKTNLSGFFMNDNSANQLSSSTDMSRNDDRNNLGWQGVAYYKKKFKNKRRNFGVNFIYADTERSTDEDLNSKSDYLLDTNRDSMVLLDQFINFKTSIRSITSSCLYLEPIAKDLSLQFSYNFIQRQEGLIRDVYDNLGNETKLNDFYTRDNDHTFRLNRAGTQLQYGKSGFNVNLGMAVQKIALKGIFKEGLNSESGIDRTFDNIISMLSVNAQPSSNKRIGFSYGENIQEPSFKNLSPIIDNSNPLFIRIGNPDLIPEHFRRYTLYFGGNNPIRFINYNFSVNYMYYINQNITEQTIDSFLITTTRMINYKGGKRAGTNMGLGFPIIKNKFTVYLNYNFSYELTKSLINEILNDAKTNTHGIGVNLSITPNDLYSLYLYNSLNYSTTSYSIESGQNYNVWNQSTNVQANAKLAFDIYFNGSLNYRIFNNAKFNSRYDLPILNASVYKLFLKDNKMEIRLSVYDLLNKNLSVRQSASVNQVSETTTFVLARYFMLSLSYNIKGIRASVKRNEGMY